MGIIRYFNIFAAEICIIFASNLFYDMKKEQQIVSAFDIKGKATAVQPFGNGHINDTFRVITEGDDTPDYVLQRINHHIFRNVDMLMDNIIAVTNHIRKKLEQQGVKDLDRRVLRFLPTYEGKYYHFDGESYWRLMICIADSESFDVVDAKYSHFAGLAFGEFQNMLADIPIKLGETIPNFHNMEFRLEEFREAVRSNRAGRVAKVSDLIEGIEQRAEAMCEGERLHRAGLLPKRICHCDTKVNNILFDREGRVLCVIDLDTVMPNFIFSDYGDFLRTAANTAAEDEPDLSLVGFNMEIFEAFTRGYLESARFLTDIEISHLPYAAALFPYMQTVRFLGDYLNGDTYYKIAYPEHNLVRARAQMKLLQSVEECMPRMKEFIATLIP